jgi:cytochrome c553
MMLRTLLVLLALGLLSLLDHGPAGARLAAQAGSGAPHWAYGYMKPPAPGESAPPCPPVARPFPDCAYPVTPTPDDGVKRNLPGSSKSVTRNEAYFDYGPADWYPEDHPAMPDIVAKGKQADGVRACALCHYPNGQGKMENGGVAGLPAAYIQQQLTDFKNGARKSADPRKANTNEMARIATKMTDEEVKAAAEYFASMKWRKWVRVVEADQAPRVRATTNGLFLPVAGAPQDPLGYRIIEMPEQPESTELARDPRSGFVAYVPVGSIAKGEALVTTGGDGRTTRCTLCHGADLKGSSVVPGIAGRTASYIVRQLYDMQQRTRQTKTMEDVVEKLTVEDMVNITAFVSSREP